MFLKETRKLQNKAHLEIEINEQGQTKLRNQNLEYRKSDTLQIKYPSIQLISACNQERLHITFSGGIS